LSSLISREDAAKLVSDFLESTSEMSLREAGRHGRVSHTKVAEWKEWRDEQGADPEKLPPLQSETVASLREGIRLANDEAFRRAALRLAADRLDKVAEELRSEASPRGAGKRAKSDAARGGKAVQTNGKPGQKRPKGGG